MVARIVSAKSIRSILHYNENKVENGAARIILASGFAIAIDRLNFNQKLFRFEQLTMLNTRSKTNAMHISLNFHVSDLLDSGKLQQIAMTYMERIGLGEQPFIAYQHLDTHHPHLHIATVLIQKDGKRILTQGIGRKLSEPARLSLEKEFSLVKAAGRRLETSPYLRVAAYGAAPTKMQLSNITKTVMREYAYVSFAQYKAVLAQFGVYADRGAEGSKMFVKKGIMYQLMDSEGKPVGVPFKASSFYQGATMKELEKHFEHNRIKQKVHAQDIRRKIDGTFFRFQELSKVRFQKELASDGVAMVFRENEAGVVYGLTFIDHGSKVVFNGRELGASYGAKAILDRLGERDVVKSYLSKELSSALTAQDVVLGERQGATEKDLLDILLKKADYDEPTVLGKKRKKKHRKGQSLGL